MGIQKRDFQLIGPSLNNDSYIGRVTWEQRYHFNKYNEFFWVPDAEITVILDEDGDWGAGPGFNVGLGYDITNNISIMLSGGFLTILNVHNLEGLGNSWLYGKMKSSIRYKNIGFFIEHISSPLHGSEDKSGPDDTYGDVGKNWVGIEYEF